MSILPDLSIKIYLALLGLLFQGCTIYFRVPVINSDFTINEAALVTIHVLLVVLNCSFVAINRILIANESL